MKFLEQPLETQAQCVIALDVGGTFVKSGVVAPGGAIIGAARTDPISSEAGAEVILQALGDIVAQRRASAPAQLRGIALGFPGPFDYEKGICQIQGLHKFAALYGVNLKAALGARFKLPILMRNDAEAALVGEGCYGAGRMYARILGVTLGTGLGSAFLVQGLPLRAGPGIPPNGWLYPLSFREERADDLFSIRGLQLRAARAGMFVDDPARMVEIARGGNAEMSALFISFGAELGQFLQPLVAAFNADAVLVLGGIAGAFDLFGPALRKRLSVRAVPGQLGSSAALLGAAELFFR